ncbi:hypothetical protein Mapa_016262 [Marchantia paleacea]|nr:hypothetical protein Mapa_016262 [Marchantia paleacea]
MSALPNTQAHDLRDNHTDRSPTRSIKVRPIDSSRQLVARHNTTPTTTLLKNDVTTAAAAAEMQRHAVCITRDSPKRTVTPPPDCLDRAHAELIWTRLFPGAIHEGGHGEPYELRLEHRFTKHSFRHYYQRLNTSILLSHGVILPQKKSVTNPGTNICSEHKDSEFKHMVSFGILCPSLVFYHRSQPFCGRGRGCYYLVQRLGFMMWAHRSDLRPRYLSKTAAGTWNTERNLSDEANLQGICSA